MDAEDQEKLKTFHYVQLYVLNLDEKTHVYVPTPFESFNDVRNRTIFLVFRSPVDTKDINLILKTERFLNTIKHCTM